MPERRKTSRAGQENGNLLSFMVWPYNWFTDTTQYSILLSLLSCVTPSTPSISTLLATITDSLRFHMSNCESALKRRLVEIISTQFEVFFGQSLLPSPSCVVFEAAEQFPARPPEAAVGPTGQRKCWSGVMGGSGEIGGPALWRVMGLVCVGQPGGTTANHHLTPATQTTLLQGR